MATTYADQASQQAAAYSAYTPTPAVQGSSSQLATPDPSQYASTSAAPQNVASSSSQPAGSQSPLKQGAEVTRKDKTLAEFLLMLDDYEPLVCPCHSWPSKYSCTRLWGTACA